MFAYCLNNPIFLIDSSGTAAVATARKTFVYDCIDFLGGCGGGGAGVIVGGGILILGPLLDALEDAREKAIAIIEALTEFTEPRDNSVYVLIDPMDGDKVKYVGRTNDPVRRAKEHKRDVRHPERAGYVMRVLVTGLTPKQAMLMEQAFISAFTLDYLDNARREIASGNIAAYESYIGAVTEIFVGIGEDVLLRMMSE